MLQSTDHQADSWLWQINDSKKLATKKRQELEPLIKAHTVWAIASCESAEIDSLGIGRATCLAMERALVGLTDVPTSIDIVLIDGRDRLAIDASQQSIIDGDAQVLSIAAASIIAKVYRDQLMVEHDRSYPNYGFGQHVGYGTKVHQAALQAHGPCPIHRLSYRPVKLAARS